MMVILRPTPRLVPAVSLFLFDVSNPSIEIWSTAHRLLRAGSWNDHLAFGCESSSVSLVIFCLHFFLAV